MQYKKTMSRLFYKGFSKAKRVSLALLIGFVFCMSVASLAHAQTNNTLILDSTQGVMPVGPYSYVTIDEENKITAQLLVSRHKSNLKGVKQSSEHLNFGVTQGPVWFLFTVTNKTNNPNWVLDFGDMLHGRTGLVRNIQVLNFTTGQRFSQDKNAGSPDAFLGAALPVRIMPNQQNLFVVFVEPANGFPVTVSPFIIEENAYFKKLVHGDNLEILANLLAILVLGFFAVILYLYKQKDSIAYLFYFSGLYGVFYILNNSFIVKLPGMSEGVILLYSLVLISGLFITKFFLDIQKDDHPGETLLLYCVAGLIVISAALYMFVLSSSGIGFGLFMLSVIVCHSTQIMLSLFLGREKKESMIYFCLGWACSLIGVLSLSLVALQLIEASSWKTGLLWFSIVPQAGFFVKTMLIDMQAAREQRRQERLRRRYEEQSLARLQKSKESVDQARLLRIIKRERELMSELREREVQRTEDMRSAKNAADKANQAKSAFLAVVSHEIRTPMTGILGMVKLLEDTQLNKKQHDYVETIKTSGDTLVSLLNDILDFEKIERGNMTLEMVSFDLHRLIQDIVTLMSGHAAQKGVSLNCDIDASVPQTVSGDPTRLRQVLLNLVNNGLKFTQEGGVTIESSCETLQENRKVDQRIVCFRVKDTGIGISKEAQRKLFTPFTQAETSTARKYGGTGLGLAISDCLIDAMGGKIQVESQEGKGSTFSFNIPLDISVKSTQEEPIDTVQVGAKNVQSMHILVVEDNEMNRKVLDGLLTKQGHSVSQAANGLEGLHMCRQEKPDIILMDVQMDGMDGIETAKSLRKDRDLKIASTPIIALTGNVMLEDIERVFEAGMNGFVAKPIDPKILDDVLSNAAQGKFENPLPDGFGTKPENTLENVDHGLELDKRELFVSDSEVCTQSGEEESVASFDVALDLGDQSATEKFPSVFDPSSKAASDTPKPLSENIEIPPMTKKDEELTEIQKFLQGQNMDKDVEERSSTEESFDNKMEESLLDTAESVQQEPEHVISETLDTDALLNEDMLQDLAGTLGQESFAGLLDGFVSKADDIIRHMEQSAKDQNLLNLGARAHELKGMAGNFGMKEVSRVATEIEKAAKTGDQKTAYDRAEIISAANEKTKTALKNWLDSL